MYLFGSNNFLWVVLEDKVLFPRASGERDLNALMFPKLQIDGLMLNSDWELIPDISTKYTEWCNFFLHPHIRNLLSRGTVVPPELDLVNCYR